MLLENNPSGNSLQPKRGVLSSLFHHHHHHHHSSSKSLSSSHSLPSSQSLSPPPKHAPFSHSTMEESVDNAEAIITKWDLNSSSYTKVTFLFHHSREEAKDFVKSVKDLRRAMNYLVAENTPSTRLVLAQKLMQIAMKRLEKEFYQILSENRESLDPESISGRSSMGSSSFGDEDREEEELEIVNESITEVERVSALAMSDLKSIAECMIVCGYAKECVKTYKVIRKSIVDEGLYRLKIERFRSAHVHKLNWEALSETIKNWLNAAKLAVKTLFNGEKMLCDHVFSSSETIRDTCFHEITKEAALNLFRFPELVAKAKKSSPEKIFQLMELYEAFSDLWPEIESTFSSESTRDVRSQALSSSLKLRDTIHSILPDFEAAIQKDFSSKTPVPGGGIHPMTLSVMEYISSLADHGGVLSGILADYPPPQGNSRLNESFLETPTSLADGSPPDAVSVHLAWLILVLLCKLDCKAELYKDAALSYIFLANNLHYIVEKVAKTASLRLLLGEDWISKHARKVNQYASNYESMAWTKVLLALPDSAASLTPPLSAEAAKLSFRKFGAAFDEAYKKQTAWTVRDGKLRDELKASIARKLVPKYREFYDANVVLLNEEKNSESVVRFSPDDLGNYLSDLFHGATMMSSSSSLSSFSSSSSLSPHRCLSG